MNVPLNEKLAKNAECIAWATRALCALFNQSANKSLARAGPFLPNAETESVKVNRRRPVIHLSAY